MPRTFVDAVKAGNIEKVIWLTDNHLGSINGADEDGLASLHWAVKYAYTPTLELLLKQQGIAINIQDHAGDTPLHWAAKLGHMPTLETLLKHPDIDINAQNIAGETPLCLAKKAWNNETGGSVILRLIAAGADVSRVYQDGSTLLHWAAGSGHIDIVNALIATKKLNVNQVDKHNSTPLYHASNIANLTSGRLYERYLEIIRALIKAGADATTGYPTIKKQTLKAWLLSQPDLAVALFLNNQLQYADIKPNLKQPLTLAQFCQAKVQQQIDSKALVLEEHALPEGLQNRLRLSAP